MSYNPFNNGRDFNPIISVDGSRLVKCPTSYEWEKEDLSNATAGRSEDGVMHKNRIGSVIGSINTTVTYSGANALIMLCISSVVR